MNDDVAISKWISARISASISASCVSAALGANIGGPETPPTTTTPRPKRCPQRSARRRIDTLLVPGEAGVGYRLPGRFGVPGRRVKMVGHPFELGVHRPEQQGRRRDMRRFRTKRFNGLGKGHSMRDRGHPLDALG